MFAGVVVVHDLGGVGEVLVGDVPDPFGAVAQDDRLADVVESAAVVLGFGLGGERGCGLKGGDVGDGAGVLHGLAGGRVAVGLGEEAADLDLARPGPAVGVFAGPVLTLGLGRQCAPKATYKPSTAGRS